MKKKFSVISFVVLSLVAAMVGCSSNESQTTPSETPQISAAAPSSILSIGPANTNLYMDISVLHQGYAAQFGLDEDYINLVWKAYLPGVKQPQTQKWDLPTINGFLQFVRVTGGADFQSHNSSAAAFNRHAQDALHDPNFDASDLQNAIFSIDHEYPYALWMKHRIFNVAKIYGIPIENVPDVNVVDDTPFKTIALAFSGEVSQKVVEVLGDDQGLRGSLIHLLESTSFQLKDSGLILSFVDFPLQDSVSEDVGFLVNQRVYGAFETSTLHFLAHP